MTKEQLGEVWRAYLQRRIDEHGGTRKLAARLHLSNHNRITNIITGTGFISPDLIIIIADRIGPSVSDIYAEIAKACIDADLKGARYERVKSSKASAPVPANAKADVERALRDAAKDERLHPKGRPAPAGESEDVPPQEWPEAASHPPLKRS